MYQRNHPETTHGLKRSEQMLSRRRDKTNGLMGQLIHSQPTPARKRLMRGYLNQLATVRRKVTKSIKNHLTRR
jgi:hypothetical protein